MPVRARSTEHLCHVVLERVQALPEVLGLVFEEHRGAV
jgi:hypothetical protein